MPLHLFFKGTVGRQFPCKQYSADEHAECCSIVFVETHWNIVQSLVQELPIYNTSVCRYSINKFQAWLDYKWASRNEYLHAEHLNMDARSLENLFINPVLYGSFFLIVEEILQLSPIIGSAECHVSDDTIRWVLIVNGSKTHPCSIRIIVKISITTASACCLSNSSSILNMIAQLRDAVDVNNIRECMKNNGTAQRKLFCRK